MHHTVASLLIDRYPPEKPKFKSPLLLIHGLWTGSWCWRTWATHFCNLGWDCWAINLPGRSQAASQKELRELNPGLVTANILRVVESLPSPPVVLAHGAGTLAALKVAEAVTLFALVLASPLPPQNVTMARSRALRLMRLKYLPLLFLHQPVRIDEKDLRNALLAPLEETLQNEIGRAIVPEGSQMVAELFRSSVEIEPGRIQCPRLVVAGTEDAIVPLDASRTIARWLGAGFREFPGQGHWIIENDGERIVRDIHRWLIQNLSDKILLAEAP